MSDELFWGLWLLACLLAWHLLAAHIAPAIRRLRDTRTLADRMRAAGEWADAGEVRRG